MSKPLAQPSRRAMAGALVKQSDPTKVVAYYCMECGTVYSDLHGKGKDNAELCSKTPKCAQWACEDCGKPAFSAYQWYCRECLSARQTRREDEALAKVLKVVAAKDYPDDQGVVYDGEYYQSLEDLVEQFDEDGCDLPKRVWGTEPSVFQMSATVILEGEFERWCENNMDVEWRQLEGIEEFEAAVEEFNKKQTLTLWWEGATAVDLSGWDELETNKESEFDQDGIGPGSITPGG